MNGVGVARRSFERTISEKDYPDIRRMWEVEHMSSVAIGQHYGGKDHTTILYHMRKMGIMSAARTMPPCVAEGCTQRAGKFKPYCRTHFRREVAPPKPEGVVEPVRELKCKFPDCFRRATALNLCFSHWRQQRRGKPLTPLNAKRDRAPIPELASPREPFVAGPLYLCDERGCSKLDAGSGYCTAHQLQHDEKEAHAAAPARRARLEPLVRIACDHRTSRCECINRGKKSYNDYLREAGMPVPRVPHDGSLDMHT